MKNNNGFTLIELLVTIVILGVISGMSFPLIRGLQERNTYTKYEKYGESLVAAAKLYVNSYEEDVFRYEDDFQKDSSISAEEKANGQTACILFRDLNEKNLINDLSMDGVTCNSPNTFVKITRKKGKYTYKYYIGCGSETSIDDSTNTLPSSEIYFILPPRSNPNDTTPYDLATEGCPTT